MIARPSERSTGSRCWHFLATRQDRERQRESVREASVNRVLPLLFQLRLSPLLHPSIAAAATAAANRKKQSTRVFKINCYDGFC